jgi:CRP-like cAMP-binding protein
MSGYTLAREPDSVIEWKNRLLTQLPPRDLTRLRRHLITLPTGGRHTLLRAGEPIRHVYFPHGGLFSVMTAMPDGTFAESAAVGREGMLGVEALLDEDARAHGDVIVQVPTGTVERLDVGIFRRELASGGVLRTVVGRYAHALLAQTMQASACNALHSVHERCAKALLLTHDRLDEPAEFRLSHESLALMLGTRRQTVTGVARAFQQAGMISYKHARLSVCDRPALEAAACACYRVIRGHVDSM